MTKHKRFFYTRGANFVTVFFFGVQLTVPWFYRHNALIQKGYDKGWTTAYKEYSAKASKAETALRDVRASTFNEAADVVMGEVIRLELHEEFMPALKTDISTWQKEALNQAAQTLRYMATNPPREGGHTN